MPRRSRRAKKQRVEKRRKTRRSQRGGEPGASAYGNDSGNRVTSIAEWVQKVLRTAPFTKQDQPEYQKNPTADEQYVLGTYTLDSLKDETLMMPTPEVSNNAYVSNNEFALGSYDARVLALALRSALSSVIPNHLTPGEFRLYIKNLKEIDLKDDALLDPQMIQLAELVECELKALATEGPKQTCDPNTILTDAANYPLLLLTLLANTPINQALIDNPPPILLSEEKAREFTESESRAPVQQGVL